MKTGLLHSRRSFIRTAAAGIAGAASGSRLLTSLGLSAQSSPSSVAGSVSTAKQAAFPLIAFSKPFQKMGPPEAADFTAEVGWDGIECPVRKGGQVDPARVEDDLPKYVEAFKARNLEISMITTDVEDALNPLSVRVLRTAAKLGIKRYRMKGANYQLDQAIPSQLEERRAKLRDLAQLNQELGIQGGLQNHSGKANIGAPVWDLWYLVKDLDPRWLGICFDIGHATLEGGYSWQIESKLAEPHLVVVYLKDFHWKKSADAWQADWVPLGQGMVSRDYLRLLKKSPYRGPISQHHEYKLGDKSAMLAAMKRDLKVLREWLAVS